MTAFSHYKNPFFFFFLSAIFKQNKVTMVKLCVLCAKKRAILKRPKTGQQICQDCFYYVFETEIHHTIKDTNLFQRGERVAIGASGGKGIHI